MWNLGAPVVRSDNCNLARRGVRSKFWSSTRLGNRAEVCGATVVRCIAKLWIVRQIGRR